jgi:hypothetical protein
MLRSVPEVRKSIPAQMYVKKNSRARKTKKNFHSLLRMRENASLPCTGKTQREHNPMIDYALPMEINTFCARQETLTVPSRVRLTL